MYVRFGLEENFVSMSLFMCFLVDITWVNLGIGWEWNALKGICTHEHNPRSEFSGPNDLVVCVVVMIMGGS